MAEKRPAGFNVPLGFYDGPEVNSICRRIRASAIGVWTLCGTFSANKLQDGYVGSEALKQFGCTAAIRDALKATKGPDGEPDPLWEEARDGGIQFTKWHKYQRSRDEVKAYRKSEAERKRNERNAAKDAATSDDSEMSGRTSDGQSSDSGDPKTKTENKEEFSHLDHENSLNVGGEERGLSAPVKLSASRLVADIVGDCTDGYSGSVMAKLRINASQLMSEVGAEITAESLRIWKTKPNLGADALSALSAEAAKTIHGRNTGPPVSGHDAKVNDFLAYANVTRLEIEK